MNPDSVKYLGRAEIYIFINLGRIFEVFQTSEDNPLPLANSP